MKETAAEHLMKAMRRVMEGQIVLSADASSHILGALSDNTNGGGQSVSCMQSLSDREFEVFERIGRGDDVHTIGDSLGISPRTVDAHRAHIREKLGLADSAALTRSPTSIF